jgi:hypothetical protein
MARRNLLRSLLAASVMVVSGSGALLAIATTPAGAVDNQITVYVRDNGFSRTDVQARVGDQLIFQLDAAATQDHTLAWDRGQFQFKFDHTGNSSKSCDGGGGVPSGSSVCYPMNNPGVAHFYDMDHVHDPNGAVFAGTLNVTKAPPPPPDTTSSSTSTTVTTGRATSTTTTTTRPEPSMTTFPATTATTGFVTIRPMLVSDPAPTTTTTTALKKKDTSDNKGKGKAASTETPTTAAPAPPAAPGLEPVFDPATLTPAPLPMPDGDGAAAIMGPAGDLDAAAVANLLPDKPADDGTPLLLAAVAAFGLFLVLAITWRWHHRASNYFPA